MRRTGTAAAIAAVAVALVGAVAFVVASDDGPRSTPVVGVGDRPLQPTVNTDPTRGKAGPNLAVDPGDENHVIELHQELATGDCEINASFDRGKTWTAGKLRAPAGYPKGSPGPCSVAGATIGNLGQQSLAFGSAGNVYVSWSATTSPRAVGSTVLLSRSVDGGATFPPAVEVPGMRGGPAPEPDFSRPELVVDRQTPGTDRLYLATRDSRSGRALVVRSDDGGTSWTGPVEASSSNPLTNPPPRFTSGTAEAAAAGDAYAIPVEQTQPVLGPAPAGGGNRPLHVGYVSRSQGTACPPHCEVAGETAADSYLVVATSTDGGGTWARTRAVNLRGFPAPSGAITSGSSFPRMAAGADGALFIVFNQGPATPGSMNCGTGPFPSGAPGASTTPCPSYGDPRTFQGADHSISFDADVWFIRSTDGGVTWGDLKQINDPKRSGLAAAEITQTRHPQVAIGAGGRIDIVWEDRRHWYLSPSVRRSVAAAGGDVLATRCVHTHAACEEARLGDTYYAGSADQGLTFTPNRRVNDRSHNNDVGYDHRISTYRDYGPSVVGLGPNQLLVADMDSRLGNPASNSLDMYLREVDLAPQAGPIAVDHLVSGDAPSFSVGLSRRAQPGGSEGVLAGEAVNRPASIVVIVNEADPAAALAGGVLARAGLGALLASPAEGLPEVVKAEVDRLEPVRAYILGDSGKLSSQVQADLAAAGLPTDRITRISAVTPADLAAAVARTMDGRTAAEKASVPPLPAFDAALVVNPASASAGSVSALAANRRLPVLYVEPDSVPAATRTALTDLGITRTLLVGSPEVVSPAVEADLPDPVRLGGGDRYATSRSVVAESAARGLPRNVVYVADGSEPMHAALLGAATGRLGGLLLLVPDGDEAQAAEAIEDLGLRNEAERLVTTDLTGTATVGEVAG